MAGNQSGVTRSLQGRIALYTALAILGVALISGAMSYRLAFSDALELQDEQLKWLSMIVDSRRFVHSDHAREDGYHSPDPESHLVVQRLADSHKPTADLPGLSPDLDAGFHTRQVRGKSWRMLVATTTAGDKFVVAQQTAMRDEIARNNALGTLVPLGALIPLLIGVIVLIIRRVFAPMSALAQTLDERSEEELGPLFSSRQSLSALPREIEPFVLALNRLLERVGKSVGAQKRFVRDAAHELRTPLTAIALQVEQLQALVQVPEIDRRLVRLGQSTERVRVLIEQLLTLARVHEGLSSHWESLSIKRLLRLQVEDLMPLIEAKDQSLSVTGEDFEFTSDPIPLRVLLKNLLENASHYTPAGGVIDTVLGVRQHYFDIIISDTGPGIIDQDLQRVFDPFYRGTGNAQSGSGLGLSIVQTIAQRLNYRLELVNKSPCEGAGLKVILTIPR